MIPKATGPHWGHFPRRTSASGGRINAITPDLKYSFISNAHAGEEQTNVQVAHDMIANTFTPVYPEQATYGSLEYAGGSEDDSKIFFERQGTQLPVTGGVPPAPEVTNVYVWDPQTESLEIAAVLPAGEGGGAPTEGARVGPPGGAISGFFTGGRHAMSDDGDYLFFTDTGTKSLYLRRGLNGGSPETIKISQSKKDNGSGPGGTDPLGARPAIFSVATPDGSKAFFTSAEELTNEANTGPGPVTPTIATADVADGGNVNTNLVPASAVGVAVDGGHIYWADKKNDRIGRAALNGSSPEPNFITGADNPAAVAVDGSHIYWTNTADGTTGTGSIGRADLPGGGGVNQSCVTGSIQSALHHARLRPHLWGNSDTNPARVARANLACGEVDQEFAGEFGGNRNIAGVAVDAERVYWMDNESGYSRISCAKVTDGSEFKANCENLFLGNIQGGAIALSGGHIYWTAQNQPLGPTTIGRADLSPTPGANLKESFVANASRPMGLAVDGSHLYFAVNQDTLPNPGNDLYIYDTENEELTDLTIDNSDLNGAEVQGVVGASEEGNRVYFAANGDLDGGGPATHGTCTKSQFGSPIGHCNLYLWEGGSITFIAPMDLEHQDQLNWQATGYGECCGDSHPSGMVSANGETIVFGSSSKLTSFNPEGTRQFYRYHVGDPGPVCITCSPTGAPAGRTTSRASRAARPSSPRRSPSCTTTSRPTAIGSSSRRPRSSSPKTPTATSNAHTPAASRRTRRPARTSTCGRRTAPARAKPKAASRVASTCCRPAQDANPQFLSDASVSGNDVFFYTHGALVPQDQDKLIDIYDASLGGGLSAQHRVIPPGCEGEACRGQGTTPPPTNGAGSAVFVGPENPDVKRKPGKTKPKKHHHKKHAQEAPRSRAGSNRGGSK